MKAYSLEPIAYSSLYESSLLFSSRIIKILVLSNIHQIINTELSWLKM